MPPWRGAGRTGLPGWSPALAARPDQALPERAELRPRRGDQRRGESVQRRPGWPIPSVDPRSILRVQLGKTASDPSPWPPQVDLAADGGRPPFRYLATAHADPEKCHLAKGGRSSLGSPQDAWKVGGARCRMTCDCAGPGHWFTSNRERPSLTTRLLCVWQVRGTRPRQAGIAA